MDFDKEDEAEKEAHWWKRGLWKWIFLLAIGLGVPSIFFRSHFFEDAMAGVAAMFVFGLGEAYIHEFRYRGKKINARLTAIEDTLGSILKKLESRKSVGE
jgi:hypothetical protein